MELFSKSGCAVNIANKLQWGWPIAHCFIGAQCITLDSNVRSARSWLPRNLFMADNYHNFTL